MASDDAPPATPPSLSESDGPEPWLTRAALVHGALRSGVLGVAMTAGQLTTNKPLELFVGALFLAGFVGLASLPLTLIERRLRRPLPLATKEALKGAAITYFFGGVLFCAAWFQAHYTDALVFGKGLSAATEAVQVKFRAFLAAPWQVDAFFFMVTLPAPFAAFAYARLRRFGLPKSVLLCVLSPLPFLVVARPYSLESSYAWGVLGSALVALPAAAAIADHEPRRKTPLLD